MIRILLVEDTPSLATEIADILRMEGFDVTPVSSGVDALNRLQVQVTDIVISDLFMPEIDGFQLIYAIKNDSRLKQIPIIILSARTTTDAIDKVKSLGGDLFIQKPCDSQYLVTSIKRLVGERQKIY